MIKRIKRKNFLEKLPPNSKLVASPSRWKNKNTVKEHGREKAIKLYHKDLHKILKLDPDFLNPLEGFDLVCYCNLDEECHVDILILHLTNKCTKDDII